MNASVGFALGAAALFGLSTPLAKMLLGSVSPVMLGGLLYLGSGIGLLTLRIVRDRGWEPSGLTRSEWPWLAGATLSLADLAAAAQISVADYLGGLDWSGHEQARGWYAVLKSRPSFRPLLSERMEVIHPPDHYAQIDS